MPTIVGLTTVATLLVGFTSQGAGFSSKSTTDVAAAKPIMLYIGDDCALREWRADHRNSISLHAAHKCPQQLFVQKDGRAAFLVYKHLLTALQLGDGVSRIITMKLPVPGFPKKCSWASVPFVQYTSHWVLNIAITCTYPYDASEAYLYAWKSRMWVLKRHISCGRFDNCNVAGHLEDGFDQMSLFDSVFMRLSRQLWNLKNSDNSYLTDLQHKRSSHPGWEAPTYWTAKFDFAGRKSILRYTILHGEDVGSPSPVGVSVRVSKGKKVVICKSGCSASLLGRYLIVYRYFGKGDDLIDLGTGKTIFRGMKFALWRY